MSALSREAERIRIEARLAAQALARQAQLAARQETLERRAALAEEQRRARERLARESRELAAREAGLDGEEQQLERARARLRDRQIPIADRQWEAEDHEQAAALALARARVALERIAGTPAETLRADLGAQELERTRAEVGLLARREPAEPERAAARLLALAGSRIGDHHLTERSQWTVPLGPPDADQGHPAVSPGELQAIEAVAGVKLVLAQGRDLVRIEGLDGVGREVARRCLAQVLNGEAGGGATAVAEASRAVQLEVEGEVVELGRRAFRLLGLPLAHPDIVNLVGRLNFRTSHMQNQWSHALEVAFLCGMLADELQLDRMLARRAALLHDIGKALTHELDGAHAVIGAEHARRLGEPELVANAVGAHHADEPFASPYAHLVAAADAMSGARPGARRHTEAHYLAQIADLERLSRGFPGVAEAFVLQGGREVRVLVNEQQLDDQGAVELCAGITRAITEQLTFPGQIRVTVIRELRALARTGD
jgi:ribonuclease Y